MYLGAPPTTGRARPGTVHLVGAGPGDPGLLTVKALEILKRADVVVHDRLVSPDVLALAPKGARRVNVSKAPKCHTMPQVEINALLVALAREGLEVVRLKGGDPLVFGRGGEEAAAIREAGLECVCVPGITSAQGAACSIGMPLTHRGLSTGVTFVTGHRASDASLDLDWAALASPDSTLVVYMGAMNISEITEKLLHQGMDPDLPVLAVSAATTPSETRLRSTLERIAADMADAAMPSPVLFVIGKVVSLYPGDSALDRVSEPTDAPSMRGESAGGDIPPGAGASVANA